MIQDLFVDSLKDKGEGLMIGKRNQIVLGGIVILTTAVLALPHFLSAQSDLGSHILAGGSWLGKSDLGTISTVTFVPSAPDNGEVAFAAEVLNFDSQTGGVFPEASNLQDGALRGEAFRTGPSTFDYVWTGYGRSDLREIVFITVGRGTLQFRDADTYEDRLTVEFYSAKEQEGVLGVLPDQDVDDDGLPDPGQEPILSLPVVAQFKRLSAALGN
jgi:hypothetical protein